MLEKYLPVGTVVRLKDGQKNLMIIGFMAAANESGNTIYDYMGALYPEGVLSSDMNFLFNHDQIVEVLHPGLVNEEEVLFKKRLVEFTTYGTIDGKVPQPNDNLLNAASMQQGTSNVSDVAPQLFNNNV